MKLFTILILFILLISCAIKRQKEAVVTYFEYSSEYLIGGNSPWYWYKFDDYKGETYKFPGPRCFDGLGAKYIIIYDSLNPYINKLDWTRPVFLSSEKTKTMMCSITKDYKSSMKYKTEIHFKYSVNGVGYESTDLIEPLKNQIIIKKGEQVEVEYWVENPQRARLHLIKGKDYNYQLKNSPTKTP